jgi:hypothetical protein
VFFSRRSMQGPRTYRALRAATPGVSSPPFNVCIEMGWTHLLNATIDALTDKSILANRVADRPGEVKVSLSYTNSATLLLTEFQQAL